MRELKSFSKDVLVKFIAEKHLKCPVRDLERIERELRIDKLMSKADELLQAQTALIGKADKIRESLRLSDEWDKLQEELDKLLGLTGE